MTRKEINEIKGLFTIEECNIKKLKGCYVDGDKNKITQIDEMFYNLPEEEQHKYLEIFRKCLTGTPGRNLIDMTFSESAISSGGARELLSSLRETELSDDSFVDKLYDKIIDTYDTVGNYLILLINQTYDVPGITEDNIEMDDASEEIYNYILCCICPVKLSKPGLSFDEIQNNFHNLERSWVVDMPEVGFLFPAFNLRSEDMDNILLYSKDTDEFQDAFIDAVLDCHIPLPATAQKETFKCIVEETVGSNCDYEVIKTINDNISEVVAQKKDLPDNGSLTKKEVKTIFERSGLDQESLNRFDAAFDKLLPKEDEKEPVLMATNIAPSRKFEVKTPDVVVKINSDKTDLVETREIDGNNYLLIRIDEGLVVNGISVG